MIVSLLIFKAGTVVGFRKAGFSYKWGENYHKNFAGPRRGFGRGFDDGDFINGHGVFGQIIKIDLATASEQAATSTGSSGTTALIIKGRDGVEKMVLVKDDTAIQRFRDTIRISDLKIDDYIVVIGEPNQEGQIEAKFIRLAPPPGQSPDALALLQAENAVTTANEAKQKTEDGLKKTYEDGFNAVANAFLDFPTILTGLNDMFFNKTIDRTQMNIDWYGNQTWDQANKVARYKNDVYTAYNAARLSYDNNFTRYKATTRSSDAAALEAIILETYETAKLLADAVKTGNNYIDFVQDSMTQTGAAIPAGVTAHQSSLDSYTGKINSLLVNLLSVKQSIADAKTALIEDDRAIIEKIESLAKLKAGPEADEIQAAQEKIREKEGALVKLKAGTDALDIQSQELTIKQRENARRDAQEKLADYFIRAPFDGVAASVDIKKGDLLSSGGAVATLITKQRLAEISLNEVDVAKVKVGQRATLSFDAVPDLELSGVVAEIDSVGAVSQGVVSYAVKITFDLQDERVKPGMSVSGNIITDTKLDVLLVPNSAVKTQGEANFVEMPATSEVVLPTSTNAAGVVLVRPPRRQAVGIGLANDEFSEIISGLKEGDMIVMRTIQPNAQTTQTQQQSGGLRIPGLPGGGFRR